VARPQDVPPPLGARHSLLRWLRGRAVVATVVSYRFVPMLVLVAGGFGL
jgi:hypothetical protein